MSVASCLGGSTEIGDAIIALRRAPAGREELAALLHEQSPIYQGLSANAAERIRGFIFASFETAGLPHSGLPFVLEELETGISPYTVAAAAKALRGSTAISDKTFALLVAAAERIAANDDSVQYETIDPTDRTVQRTSALAEIIHTIAEAGPRARPLWAGIEAMADCGNMCPEALAAIELACRRLAANSGESCCCAAPAPLTLPARSPAPANIDDLALEDQSGETVTYRDFFYGRPSVVTFFYTRCMNPEKCSLTVSKLAALQRRLVADDLSGRVTVGALTYDPLYDHPRRLQIYGLDRGFRFDDRNRFLRTLGSFAPVRDKFDLGVGFGTTTVNRHSVELLVLDNKGAPVREFRRVQWGEAEVVAAIRAVADGGAAETIERPSQNTFR
jgi:cytochrome oxidase Cu insertion factor (SCO1/SenC/PrrC family)